MNRASLIIIASVAVVAHAGCKDDASARPPDTITVATKEATWSRRSRLVPHRALFDEVARAELDAGGLVIDLGAPDQHKYTRGGWKTGWGESGVDGDASWTVLQSRRAWLTIPGGTQPSAIVVRARSGDADQRIGLFAGERELGVVPLETAWTVARVAIASGAWPADGRTRLELRALDRSRKPIEVDWVWLARGPGDSPPLGRSISPIAIAGTSRRALVASPARTYSFYVAPTRGSHLVADLGATGHATFRVAIATDGGAPVDMLRERVAGKWVERAISLGDFADRAIRIDLTTEDVAGDVGWGEPEIMIEPATSPASSLAIATGSRPTNVIVLVIDTARADAFAPFAGPDRVAHTPSYDDLARRSTVFTAAYNNENWTKPSVATTLSGLYPSTHDTKRDPSVLPDDVELLPERLRRDGFATAAFVANGYVSGKFGFEQGWNTFRNYIRESKPSEAEHVFSDALAWLDRHRESTTPRPFLLYIQTIDPHVVYRVDKEYWGRYFDGDYRGPLGPSIEAADQIALSAKTPPSRDVDWLRALYWGEITYHDDHLGKFLGELATRGVWNDTLLVVTNDHGEELGERGRFGHGHQVFEEMIRAPLLFHYPPLFAATEIAEVVEHVDVAPTIVDALGLDPLNGADGESFMALVRGTSRRSPSYAVIEFLDSRRVVRVGRWKLIARADGSAVVFDLVDDPREARELDGAISRRLCEVHLGEALGVPDKGTRMHALTGRRKFRSGAADIDPQMRRQLEALGYFGSGPGQ